MTITKVHLLLEHVQATPQKMFFKSYVLSYFLTALKRKSTKLKVTTASDFSLVCKKKLFCTRGLFCLNVDGCSKRLSFPPLGFCTMLKSSSPGGTPCTCQQPEAQWTLFFAQRISVVSFKHLQCDNLFNNSKCSLYMPVARSTLNTLLL